MNGYGYVPNTIAFLNFHAMNPHIYDYLLAAARQYRKATGHAKCGMSLLIGRARWVSVVQTQGDDFRVNNNHAGYYARLLMNRHPELAGMFNLRPRGFEETNDFWMVDAL